MGMTADLVDLLIGRLRNYLSRDLVSAFYGKMHFEPQRDWAEVVSLCMQIRANDHLLNAEQRQSVHIALTDLQNNLNAVVEVLREASSGNSRTAEQEAGLLAKLNSAVERVNVEFADAARRHFELRAREHPTIHNHGDIHMGDIFSHISNSTIVSRSSVERAFNSLKESGNGEAADLILEISKLIQQSNSHAAAAIFSQISEQVTKPSPDKGIIKSCWEGLVAILPSIAAFSGQFIKVLGL